jgi:hypothetical protein
MECANCKKDNNAKESYESIVNGKVVIITEIRCRECGTLLYVERRDVN